MAILTEIPAENGADAAAQDRQIQPMEHEVQNNDNGRDHARVSFNSFFLSNWSSIKDIFTTRFSNATYIWRVFSYVIISFLMYSLNIVVIQ